jgi:putative salt-induced outer membrane protein YdiY
MITKGLRAAFLLVPIAVWGDQIVMKNGDRVSGTIVKKDAKTLTIKSAHFGTVTLPWDQVESAKADTAINIVLPNDQTVSGTFQVEKDQAQVTTGGSTRTVPPADLVALRDAAEQKAYDRLQKPGWGDLWLGNASIGWAGTKGNAETATWTTGLTAGRVTRTDKTTVYFNAIRASALVNQTSATTAQAVRGGVAYNRNLKPRIFLNTFNDWEYDRFQNLDLRIVAGGGLGVNVWKGEKGRFDLLGGVAWNRERFDPVRPQLPFTRTGADGYWGDDFNYKVGTRTNLFQSFRMFNNLKDGERYRINFDTGATTQLTKWLTWNISISDRFLNLPVSGRKKNDFLYTTGFGFTFAR